MSDGAAREYWRALEDRDDSAERREALAREFPAGAAERSDGLSRRTVLKLLGATVALAGLDACMREPTEKILPYVGEPPELTPGIAQHYATTMMLGGYGTGLLVESHTGRPTKIEGNPDHPASLGAAGVFEQASVLQLYDPHRARFPTHRGRRASRDAALGAVAAIGVASARDGGAGLHIVLEPTSSPLIGELLGRLQQRFPRATVHFHAPVGRDAVLAGMSQAVGQPLEPQYDFRIADVVLSLDADFLAEGPGTLRFARDFAARRLDDRGPAGMSRLYVAETAPSPTGTLADHRLRVRPSSVTYLAAAVCAELLTTPAGAAVGAPPDAVAALGAAARTLDGEAGPPLAEWIRAVAGDLGAHRGRSIVVAGAHQPAAVHAVAHLMNAVLGNVGRSVWYIDSPLLAAGQPTQSLVPLADQLRRSRGPGADTAAGTSAPTPVETLVILGGNPVYTAGAEADLAPLIRAVPHSVYLGLYANETAEAVEWMVPAAHYLEAWGDARAYDGTLSVVQPLIDPLYGGQTAAELLAILAGEPVTSAYALVRASMRRFAPAGGAFEDSWSAVVQRGLLSGSASPRIVPRLQWATLAPALRLSPRSAGTAATDTVELSFRASHAVYDGSFADVAWLQELPQPLTKLTWDNAALMSPATAAALGVATDDVIALGDGTHRVTIPVFVLPGHADGAVTVHFGYGRTGAEVVARDVGTNVYPLRPAATPGFASGITVERMLADGGAVKAGATGEAGGAGGANTGGAPLRHRLATTQRHWSLDGRPIVLEATREEYARNPDFTRAERRRMLTLYDPYPLDRGDQWAMTIDLSTCTGCSACVVACQAENNVPVVGRAGVLASREMHWLRIDRYFTDAPDDPAIVMQPMLCQQCERAPCEYVCPVNATVHSPDGLNEMVYNRCVGTRFCSNNCPYKVRRFNWFDYNAEIAATVEMVENPDVTVRARGVMEKCTFCVQRIRRADIEAAIDGVPTHAKHPITACAQACPTQAITFGSLTDPDPDLVRRLAERRRYAVLHELGTRPRVQYLARIRNPNPALAPG